MSEIDFIDVAISLALVALALVVSRVWRVPVQKEMSIGVVRAFVQLVLIGYALEWIFKIDHLWLIALVMLVMLAVGAHEASVRTKKTHRGILAGFQRDGRRLGGYTCGDAGHRAV